MPNDDDDDYVKIYLSEEVETKIVNNLITADMRRYDIISSFPKFRNDVQVIRMSTNDLEDVRGENCKIPNSFCQMQSLKELFLFGDPIKAGDGLSSLPMNFGNLIRLEVLNLEYNCFGIFPEQICQLRNLKKLYLNSCGLTSISTSINQLVNLVEADLSHNNFTSGLCKELFDLPKLKDLYLIKCQLNSLPEAIGNLKVLEGLRLNNNFLKKFPENLYTMGKLIKLVADDNQISELSSGIIGLQSLKTLSLQQNNLTTLPHELSKLPHLRSLNVFGNNLTCLPESIQDLDPSTMTEFHGNNFLIRPPLNICTKGIESIKGFFLSMADGKKKIHSNHIKIVMLGEAGAGKTCLTRALVDCKAHEAECHDSTIGVEMYHCDIGGGLQACIVDCAGQRRYQLTHPFFLSEEALHIIVVNLKEYQSTKESFEENVEDWINWITARLLKPRIMIVATHRDECDDIEVKKKCEHILKEITEHEKREMKRLEKEIKALSAKHNSSQADRSRKEDEARNLHWLKKNRPFISSKLLLDEDSEDKDETAYLNLVPISSKKELQGMILLRSEINRVVKSASRKSNPTPEASSVESHKENALFPLVGIVLPGSWVDLEKAIIEYRKEVQPPLVPCMTMEQFEKFAFEKAGLRGSEVVSGLTYLDSIGEIKFYSQIPKTEYSVFLDLPWLCKLVKLLFRHDYDDNDALVFQDEFSEHGMESVMFDRDLSELKNHGKLSATLLRCIWMELELSDIEFQNMIKSFVRFGLACEIPGSNSEEMMLFIPWFLHTELDEETKKDIFPDTPPSNVEELRLKFCISGYLPAGMFDRLCVRSFAHGIDADTWKNSMRIFIDDTPIYLQLNKSEVTLIGRTTEKTDLRKLWTALLKIINELRDLLSEWPRLVYHTYTVCPHCVKKGASKPYPFQYKWWEVEQISGTTVRCKKSKVHCQTIDINLVIPPKDVLKRHELANRPVTEPLLRDLSERIPNDWKTIGTHLDIPNYELATISNNYPGNVTEQAFTMLQSWKEHKGEQADIPSLVESLKKAGRSDLESFVLGTL